MKLIERFVDFGIVEDEKDFNDLISNVELLAKKFEVPQEEVPSFIMGFLEGTIFNNISNVSEMFSKGYDIEEIHKITSVNAEKLKDIQQLRNEVVKA